MKLVQTREECIRLAERIDREPVLGFDTESHGPLLESGKMLNVFRSTLTGTSVAFPDDTSYYVPINHKRHNASFGGGYKVLEALAAYKGTAYCHNSKHETHVLGDGLPSNARCTMLMAWMLELYGIKKGKRSYGLAPLMEKHFGVIRPAFNDIAKGRGWNEVNPRDGLKYACDDALDTLRLGLKFEPMMEEYGLVKVFEEQELPLVPVLAAMERRGMHVDTGRLERLAETVGRRQKELIAEWDFLFPGVMVSSTKQVRDYFYGNKLWPVVGAEKTPKGALSVNRANMELALSHAKTGSEGRAAAEIRCEVQDCAKILSTYTHSLVAKAEQHLDGRLRPSFLQTGTMTGRLSCIEPNLMQIPVRSALGLEVKDAFRAPEGFKLVSADYSQQDLRCLAHMAKQGPLVDTFHQPGDFFDNMADDLIKPRGHCKTAMYSYVFGSGPAKVGSTLGIGRKGGKELMATMEARYPALPRLRRAAIAQARELGFVRLPSGRIRRLDDIHSQVGWKRSKDERRAFNTWAQGTTADVVKQSMLKSHAAGLHLVCQVHDENVCEETEESIYNGKTVSPEDTLRRCMEEAWPGFRVPLKAEPVVVDSWKETK